MRKTLLWAATALLLLAGCQQSLEEKAANEARKFTRENCPSPMGENMIIDSMTFDASTRTLHYHYRLTGAADANPQLDGTEARKALLHDLKNTTAIKSYKDAGFNFAYTYRSQKDPSRIVFDFKFTAADYR